jgi:small subunit ribosomal protein S16
MLTIRLTRKGKKNQPFFRVVLVDKRKSSKAGSFVEDLGYKNPLTKKVSLNKERILYWISKGAQPSPSIKNLLITEKIIDDKKTKITNISKKKKAEMAEAAKATAVPPATVAPEAAPAQEAKPAEPATPPAA